MKRVEVMDPQGHRWAVAVRWLPWSVRWRGPRRRRKRSSRSEEGGRWYDFLDVAEPLAWFDEGVGGFVAVLIAIVLVVVAVLFALPLFIFLIELLIVAVVVALGFVLRVVLRRPWIIEAVRLERDTSAHLAWKLVGYRRAARAVEDVANQLRAGVAMPVVPDAAPITGLDQATR